MADEELAGFADVARWHDFSDKADPVGSAWMSLGGDNTERYRNLAMIRSVVKRAVDENREAGR